MRALPESFPPGKGYIDLKSKKFPEICQKLEYAAKEKARSDQLLASGDVIYRSTERPVVLKRSFLQ